VTGPRAYTHLVPEARAVIVASAKQSLHEPFRSFTVRCTFSSQQASLELQGHSPFTLTSRRLHRAAQLLAIYDCPVALRVGLPLARAVHPLTNCIPFTGKRTRYTMTFH
jgi:hypothetical protein